MCVLYNTAQLLVACKHLHDHTHSSCLSSITTTTTTTTYGSSCSAYPVRGRNISSTNCITQHSLSQPITVNICQQQHPLTSTLRILSLLLPLSAALNQQFVQFAADEVTHSSPLFSALSNLPISKRSCWAHFGRQKLFGKSISRNEFCCWTCSRTEKTAERRRRLSRPQVDSIGDGQSAKVSTHRLEFFFISSFLQVAHTSTHTFFVPRSSFIAATTGTFLPLTFFAGPSRTHTHTHTHFSPHPLHPFLLTVRVFSLSRWKSSPSFSFSFSSLAQLPPQLALRLNKFNFLK